jgi:Cys-tRNA(Pro)/Cys-tRNA(Cys) deacylase
MSGATPAVRLLQAQGIAFALHRYAYGADVRHIGLHAAEALGEAPEHVLKTLLAEVDGRPVCAVLRADREMAMKRLAAACGGRSARLLAPEQAERISGYKIGGVSPLGQRRRLPTVVDAQALGLAYVYINAGQRGLQLRIDPAIVVAHLGALVAPLTA